MFQECSSSKNVPVPRMFPNDCFVQNFLQVPQQKTIVNDLDDDEDEPEEDLPKSPATPSGESVNDNLHNFSLSQLNVNFQCTFPEHSQNTIYKKFRKLCMKTFLERFENGFYYSYCSVLFQPSFLVDPTAEALDAMLKKLNCMDRRLQRVEGQLVRVEEGVERIEDSFALNNSRKTQGDDAVKARSKLPLLTVEAFHAFDRQFAKNTSVRTTINVPEPFQTCSQFVSAEADAEKGNQVLSGKETFTMCPGACDGALSHCAHPVPKAHHHFLRMLRENNLS